MPKKSKSKKLDLNRIEELASFEPPKSYQNLLYGVLTVFVIFILIFLGIKIVSQRMNSSIGEAGIQTENVYVVKAGDSLWSIAENRYNDGYKWVDIAAANNLSNPGEIEKGMKLVLPEISAKAVEPTGVSPSANRATSIPTNVPTVAATIIPTKVAVKVPSPTASKPSAAVNQEGQIKGASYTVVQGDNLWNIAVRAYGDGYKWVEIAKANKLANPDLIHAGNKFVLPR